MNMDLREWGYEGRDRIQVGMSTDMKFRIDIGRGYIGNKCRYRTGLYWYKYFFGVNN
jgi:hypothetical protein